MASAPPGIGSHHRASCGRKPPLWPPSPRRGEGAGVRGSGRPPGRPGPPPPPPPPPPPRGARPRGRGASVVVGTALAGGGPHRVTLTLPARGGRGGGVHFKAGSRPFEVEPGKKVRGALLARVDPPVVGCGLSVDIDGRRQP